MAHLLVSQEYLKARSIIDDNVDFKKLTPIIELVQDIYLCPALGSDLYDEIITQSTQPTSLTAANQTLLDDHILKVMIPYIQFKAPLALQYRFMNKGIVTRTSDQESVIDAQNLKYYMQEWKSDAESYVKRMTDYILAHQSDYPAYFTNNGLDRIIPQMNGFNIDMYLPDTRSFGLTNDTGPIRKEDGEHTQPF